MQVYGNNLLQNNIKVIDKVDNKPLSAGATQSKPVGGNDFQSILQSNMLDTQPIQFSRHASLRLNSREINLTKEQMQRVEGAISKAQEKGIRDSLVLVDDVALVVNIKSKVVVTAMNQSNKNIFTNIDGAVIV